MKETVKQRLIQYIKKERLSQKRFEEIIGVSNGYVELGKLYEGCTSYWCRHTWASIAASLDIPIETISQALGHSFGASVTNIYIHYDTRKVDEANRKVIDCITKEKPDAGSASGGCDI